MALTMDTIVNKVFSTGRNGDGYDRNEVDDFLDEILEEMENREKETDQLKKQIEDLNAQLASTQEQLTEAKAAAATASAHSVLEDTRSSESFEVVLNKARVAYDEIIVEAKTKAESIISDANSEAVNIRTTAQKQITDLSDRLASLRRQTSDYYEQLSKVIEKQSESMSDLKRLL